MIIIYYMKWVGQPDEFAEFMGRMTNIWNGIEGADIKGVFLPVTQKWSFAFLLEVTSYEKAVKAYKTYMQKYGLHPKVTGQKIDMFHTMEELGIDG
ncbi:MAG: hypothetical protein ACFFCQ_12175 [Promethearchaeota archaeon]